MNEIQKGREQFMREMAASGDPFARSVVAMSDEPKLSNAEFVEQMRRFFAHNGDDIGCRYANQALDRLEAAEAFAKHVSVVLLEWKGYADGRKRYAESLEVKLKAAEARVKELETEHGPLKCAKMLPPKTRPDFYVDPEDK